MLLRLELAQEKQSSVSQPVVWFAVSMFLLVESILWRLHALKNEKLEALQVGNEFWISQG